MRWPQARAGFANYPTTVGPPALREAIAGWLARRHDFARARPGDAGAAGARQPRSTVRVRADRRRCEPRRRDGGRCRIRSIRSTKARRCSPARRLYCVNADPANGFAHAWRDVPDAVWARTQLLYVCSPDNPTGRVIDQDEWRQLFELSDRHGFVIAADECYSEIYFDEAQPPLGALAAAQALGRDGFPRLVVVRQPVEALERAGTALGLRRRRRGADQGVPALSHVSRLGDVAAVAAASIAAWNDEEHVRANRALYARKFASCSRGSTPVLPCADAGSRVLPVGAGPRSTTPSSRGASMREENVSRAARQLSWRATPTASIRAGAASASRWSPRMAECAEAVERLVAFARAASDTASRLTLTALRARDDLRSRAGARPSSPTRHRLTRLPGAPRIARHDDSHAHRFPWWSPASPGFAVSRGRRCC